MHCMNDTKSARITTKIGNIFYRLSTLTMSYMDTPSVDPNSSPSCSLNLANFNSILSCVAYIVVQNNH